MMYNESHRQGLFCVLACLALSACSGGDGSAGDSTGTTGNLSLLITDAPVHTATEVWVQFTGVTVKPQEGEPIEVEYDDVRDIDLMSLTGGNTEPLLDGGEFEVGPYNWIRLHVNADADGLFDSYVMTEMGEMIELEVPSQQGLQLSSGFTILQGQTTSLVIDWDLNQGLVQPQNQDEWMLRPSLRITDMSEAGEMTGMVAESLLMADTCTSDLAEDKGNAVYVFEGADVIPDDIDEIDPDPLATTSVTQDMNGMYVYTITFLPAGEYTAAVTCQALDDDPATDDEIAFIGATHVTVSADEEAVVDFE